MSPSTAATRNLPLSSGRVFSMSEVLPAPGEAMILIENTPAASIRAKFSSARRSLALRMFSTTEILWVMRLFYDCTPI